MRVPTSATTVRLDDPVFVRAAFLVDQDLRSASSPALSDDRKDGVV